jgi:hypothetical protein
MFSISDGFCGVASWVVFGIVLYLWKYNLSKTHTGMIPFKKIMKEKCTKLISVRVTVDMMHSNDNINSAEQSVSRSWH